MGPGSIERKWGLLSPEVASALGKLKSYLKPDGTYDWAKIITLGTTQQVLAAEKAFNIESAVLKGVKTNH